MEDHPLVRAQLEQVINAENDLSICGVAEERQQALRLIVATKPDLVLTELVLADSCGLALLKDLEAQHPKILTLIMSGADEATYAERAMRAGARGYIATRDSANILPAIRRVLEGKLYLSEGLILEFASRFLNRSSTPKQPIDRLTDQELKVFDLIGQGFNTRSIANTMHLGFSTVGTYRARIKQKLRLEGSQELLRASMQRGSHPLIIGIKMHKAR